MLRAALLAFALLASAAPALAQREAGLPLLDYFGVRDYQQHNQTWSIVQDRGGTLYIGNKDCVLVYDGQTWRAVPVPGLFIRGLATDEHDRIWVGGVNELGYLDADANGQRHYTSLLDQMPPELRKFGEVEEIFVSPHGIYFSTDAHLLRWHEGRFTRVVDNDDFYPWKIGDEIVCWLRDGRLRAFNGREWRTLCDDPFLRQTRVVGVLPVADGALLVVTRAGIRRLADGVLSPWPTEADALFRQRAIGWAWQLRDGGLVISFRPHGLLFLDAQGRFLRYLDEDNTDLPSAAVARLFQDQAGDIWITLTNGLLRLSWPPAISTFGKVSGLGRGTAKTMARVGDRLYAGTSNGVFVLHPAKPDSFTVAGARFEAVAGITRSTWGLASAGGDLLAAAADGLYVVRDGAVAQKISPTGNSFTAVLALAGRPDSALVGTFTGVRFFHRESGEWKLGEPLPGIAGEVRAVVQEADGTVWVAVTGEGFYRISDATGATPVIEHYSGGHGLTSKVVTGIPQLATSGGRALFLDDRQVFTFDPVAREFRSAASARAQFNVAELRQTTLGSGLGGMFWTRTLWADAASQSWNGRAFWRVTPPATWEQLPVAFANAIGENPVLFEETSATGTVLWAGGSEGLVRAEIPAALLRPRDFSARVSQVRDSTGRFFPRAAGTPQVLPHRFPPLTLAFASDRLDQHGVEYRILLEGRDDEWTAFTPEGSLTLAGLATGSYTLHVEARDAEARISAPATISFRVLPAWWETWWALALYAAGLAVAVTGIVRWRSRSLRWRNDELERTIATRTAELREAKTAAEAASQAKSAFLASMSHELRTPLNAILGYAQILRRETGLSSKGRHQLGIVGRNGEHLLQMINEVLDLAKIEAGKMTLHAADFPLTRVVKSAGDLLEQRAADKGLAFRLELGAGLPRIVATDEQKIRQVLLNLLGNAVKFTERGEVVLAVHRRDGQVRFEVRDTGPGIALDQIAAIFQPFHQVLPPTAPQQGTGLGLTISQRLVALLGGVLQVESQLGRGSRFWFDLTLPEVAAPTGHPATTHRIAGYHGVRRQLLLVDDEPTNRAVLRDLLEPLGFAIEEAADGAAGLAAVTARPFDAVLLDIRMPVLGGLETVARLRTLAQGRAIPVVAVSASVLGFNQDHARAAGCDAFLPKPVQEAQLLETLGRLLHLEWEYGEQDASAESWPAPTGELPDAALLETLAVAARRGDVDALREHIAAALAEGALGGDFLRQLDELAATFRTAEIRQRLAETRPASPP